MSQEEGLRKLNEMIDKEMEEYEKSFQKITVEDMLKYMPSEINCYNWPQKMCRFCKDKELKDNSDEFKSHLKHHK